MSAKMASVEEELTKLNSKLKKVSDGIRGPEEAYQVFEMLEQMTVNAETITKTRIAMTINELRKKTSDEKLAKRGKALIRKWKVYFESQQTTNKERRKSIDGEPPMKKALITEKKGETSPSDGEDEQKQLSRKSSNVQTKSSNVQVFKRDMPKDEKRAKIVSVLLKSLSDGELPEHTQDPEDVATRIEHALYERFGDISPDYFSAARSRASNLRDKKNPDLRENVLTGAVTPERFAHMSTDEMASDAMKQQREEFTKEAIMEHQMSVQEGTPSDMFRCGRCGKNNCTYTQVQTRSADEPMTTFVFCRTCGNRWKFC